MKYNLKNLLYFFKKKTGTHQYNHPVNPYKTNINTYLPAKLEFMHRHQLFRPKTTDLLKFDSIEYRRCNKSDYSFDDSFFLQLKQAIAWTEDLLRKASRKNPPDPVKIFRQTDPVYDGKIMHRFLEGHGNYVEFNVQYFDYQIPLEQALRARQAQDLNIPNAHLLGRVLEFDIDVTTSDGAPTAESMGFVDNQDIPPIDTWFYLTQSHLYCWIPNICIPIMQSAIDVEILDSYRWIQESNPTLQKKIEVYLISNP